MPGKKTGERKKKRKKRRQCVKTLQKQVGVVGDDSLTGQVVAGRLDETTASTTDDSASLSGSVVEVPCNTVVVADEDFDLTAVLCVKGKQAGLSEPQPRLTLTVSIPLDLLPLKVSVPFQILSECHVQKLVDIPKFMKLSTRLGKEYRRVMHDILQTDGFTWSLAMCGYAVPSSCLATRKLPSTIKSAADAVLVMQVVDSSKVCTGNNDVQFATLMPKFINHQTEDPSVAFVESSCLGKPTIRHSLVYT
ncbi:hypothetical protein EMCRGX_G005205 [Ephydatia muelleri]